MAKAKTRSQTPSASSSAASSPSDDSHNGEYEEYFQDGEEMTPNANITEPTSAEKVDQVNERIDKLESMHQSMETKLESMHLSMETRLQEDIGQVLKAIQNSNNAVTPVYAGTNPAENRFPGDEGINSSTNKANSIKNENDFAANSSDLGQAKGQFIKTAAEPPLERQSPGLYDINRLLTDNVKLENIQNLTNVRKLDANNIVDKKRLIAVAISHVINGPVGLNKITTYNDFNGNKFDTSIRALFKNSSNITHSSWLELLKIVKTFIPSNLVTPMTRKYGENYPNAAFYKDHPDRHP
ncbi:hypothetical protein WICMUC_005844 [Wickerhamomyces mucosus]|uniref:Uncharacterized protein n=1 Tax=Wickerhamomyces mucosus TaxID=1378264 RepID=A0A9P8P3E5_9ASCO|nr:hypothetical protein WICMUC_005844 [Wickerhamomyces mucosus]